MFNKKKELSQFWLGKLSILSTILVACQLVLSLVCRLPLKKRSTFLSYVLFESLSYFLSNSHRKDSGAKLSRRLIPFALVRRFCRSLAPSSEDYQETKGADHFLSSCYWQAAWGIVRRFAPPKSVPLSRALNGCLISLQSRRALGKTPNLYEYCALYLVTNTFILSSNTLHVTSSLI
jgi:hypothetical protein